MKIEEALKIAFEELDSVQFIDNTAKEASEAKAEVRYILRGLAVRLTQRAADLSKAGDSSQPDTVKSESVLPAKSG